MTTFERAPVASTGLWQRSLGATTTHQDEIRRLVSSLDRIRERINLLTQRISDALPDLTVHDLTHLDALWETADVIAGDSFPLNPLEAYVFGCAVLLHDSALCFEAYSGGKQGVRQTTVWKDAYGRLTASHSDSEEVAREADFEALRFLHANQAAKLPTDPWTDSSGGDQYLIDDVELREDYGHLMGLIAASHHWDLKSLDTRLSSPHPPSAFLPRDWIVEPIKLACLLRCADAAHIDGARAPSFLLKILRMNMLSRHHWVAQNHLGRVIVDPTDATRLLIASTRPFHEDEAPAWWVAFDAIEVLDRELKGCNRLLAARENSGPGPFARASVIGAGSVDELKEYVKTEGWDPTDTKVHVSDVAALIGKLGGEQLYGNANHDKLAATVRELVQNASDAVRARRVLEDEEFQGKIRVRLKAGADPDTLVLEVDDDGVGMSPQTLTGELMDFGEGLWPSARAAQEFPGIQSSGYSPTGQFGIGFFSVFMIASSVRVISRRFDKGLDSVRCLSFTTGLSLRPTLSCARPSDFGMNCSTRVELTMRRDVIPDSEKMEILVNITGYENLSVSFADYVSSIVAGIPATVFVEHDGHTECVHDRFPPRPQDRGRWLRQLAYMRSQANPIAEPSILTHVPWLREILDGETCYGLAALNTLPHSGCRFVSARAVGGLAPPHNRHDEAFVGLINYNPANAKRDAGALAAPRGAIREWLEEQATLLTEAKLDPLRRLAASNSLCELDWDPMPILSHLLVLGETDRLFVEMAQLVGFLKNGARLGFRISSFGAYIETYGELSPIPGVYTYIPMDRGKFHEVALQGGKPQNPYSLVGIIQRRLESDGADPRWERVEGVYQGPFGRCDLLEVKI